MIALIQRVTQSTVTVEQQEIAKIQQGILALVAIEQSDTQKEVEKLVKKLLGYRIFSDKDDAMNLNVQQVQGSLLLVPQFTLAADTKKGLRPGFSCACQPYVAKEKFNDFVALAQKQYNKVCTGEFGANMQVSLINDGPVTFWLQV